MTQTIDRLMQDHRRLRHVLDALADVTQKLNDANISEHIDQLFCVIDYLVGYPDKVHHPAEDLVFKKLLDIDLTAEEHDAVSLNQSQHRYLKAATLDLKLLLDAPGDNVDVQRFVEEANTYLQLQHEHMRHEEKEIFPLSRKYIAVGDWSELDKRYGETTDPLFDEPDKRYQALYRILSIDANQEMSDGLLRFLSSTWLADVST